MIKSKYVYGQASLLFFNQVMINHPKLDMSVYRDIFLFWSSLVVLIARNKPIPV